MYSLFERKVLVVPLVLLLVWLGAATYRVYRQKEAIQEQLVDVQGKVTAIQAQNHFLASASAYFSSDIYREREARIKLNYKLSDEHAAFVYESSSSAQTASKSAAPFWRQWLDALFKRD